jgi:hypothetical protein
MLDDRICPSCQVLLRDGTRTCVKCGKMVEPEKTHLGFIDWTRKIYPRLVHHLGPVGGGVVAGAVFLILLILWVGQALIKSILGQ